MTATDAAPDPVADAERRWQDLLDRIHDLEARTAATTSTVTTALDHHLARLDALRRQLAHPDWPLSVPDPGGPRATPATTRAAAVTAVGPLVPDAPGDLLAGQRLQERGAEPVAVRRSGDAR
ncbi:hypothetical protein [Kitasatospora brasiliensis]|uniref:hypothetical protein n=1 Tax=Kitasatospora brasiliensis TaxID=3058040 RepID=UPI00292D2259|nr:hypothetical protein [Kitasatospora sp. K002]